MNVWSDFFAQCLNETPPSEKKSVQLHMNSVRQCHTSCGDRDGSKLCGISGNTFCTLHVFVYVFLQNFSIFNQNKRNVKTSRTRWRPHFMSSAPSVTTSHRQKKTTRSATMRVRMPALSSLSLAYVSQTKMVHTHIHQLAKHSHWKAGMFCSAKDLQDASCVMRQVR